MKVTVSYIGFGGIPETQDVPLMELAGFLVTHHDDDVRVIEHAHR